VRGFCSSDVIAAIDGSVSTMNCQTGPGVTLPALSNASTCHE
jgi:hypothetical protein